MNANYTIVNLSSVTSHLWASNTTYCQTIIQIQTDTWIACVTASFMCQLICHLSCDLTPVTCYLSSISANYLPTINLICKTAITVQFRPRDPIAYSLINVLNKLNGLVFALSAWDPWCETQLLWLFHISDWLLVSRWRW